MPASDPSVLRFIGPDEAARCVHVLSVPEREILDEVNRKVAAAQSLAEILDFVSGAVSQVSLCDRMSLAFVEEQGRRVVSHITHAAYEPVLLKTGYAEDLHGSSLETILRDGTMRIISDLQRYLELRPASRSTKILLREGVRSSMTCPLRVDDRVVGLFFRSARQPDAYQLNHACFHLAMAERLSQAVEKAYRIEQLDAANRAYFEMLGFVTHELKSPVASMIMDAQLLNDGYLGDLEPKQREKLLGLIKKGHYLLGLVNEYLDLARLESGQLEPRFRENVNFVSEVVEPAVDIIRPQMDARQMTLTRDWQAPPPAIHSDPQLLRIVMVNLLGNAVKYGRDHGEVRIHLAADDSMLTASVWNEGPGFSAAQRHLLFRKFSRLDKPELRKAKGTGVGLYTCWRIIQAHRGTITAESDEGEWAEFTFRLPLLHEGLSDPE